MMTFAEFETEARAQGYDEVVQRQWKPLTVVAEHAHPFEASALVVEGEMWLTVKHQTQHLRPGDRFHLPHGILHDERYGPEGASYWVARRNAD